MIYFNNWNHLVSSHVHNELLSSKLIMDCEVIYWSHVHRDGAHEAMYNDDEASSWVVSIIGTHLVQSHVRGDEPHQQRWSRLLIDCELTLLEACARRRSSWSSRTTRRIKLMIEDCKLIIRVMCTRSSWKAWCIPRTTMKHAYDYWLILKSFY